MRLIRCFNIVSNVGKQYWTALSFMLLKYKFGSILNFWECCSRIDYKTGRTNMGVSPNKGKILINTLQEFPVLKHFIQLIPKCLINILLLPGE